MKQARLKKRPVAFKQMGREQARCRWCRQPLAGGRARLRGTSSGLVLTVCMACAVGLLGKS